MGGLNLTSYDNIKKGGTSGPAIVPNNPASSLLVTKTEAGHAAQFSPEELDLIKKWIAAGAPNN